jgi:hypothetical protein
MMTPSALAIAAEYETICSKLLRVGADDELGARRKPKVIIEVTEREAMAELNDAGPRLNYFVDRHLPLCRNAEFRQPVAALLPPDLYFGIHLVEGET